MPLTILRFAILASDSASYIFTIGWFTRLSALVRRSEGIGTSFNESLVNTAVKGARLRNLLKLTLSVVSWSSKRAILFSRSCISICTRNRLTISFLLLPPMELLIVEPEDDILLLFTVAEPETDPVL